MFFNIIYNLPIFRRSESRNMIVLTIALILYIILIGFTFTSYSNESLQEYRYVIYYVFAADLCLVFGQMIAYAKMENQMMSMMLRDRQIAQQKGYHNTNKKRKEQDEDLPLQTRRMKEDEYHENDETNE